MGRTARQAVADWKETTVSRYRETEPQTEHVPEPPELNLSDLPTIDGRARVVALAANGVCR